MDAAGEFSNIVETLDSIRADLAEFRHETRRELEAMNARLGAGATRADLAHLSARIDGCATKADVAQLSTRLDTCATKADVAQLSTRLDTCATKADVAQLEAKVTQALLMQTRWTLAGLVTVVLAIYFRT